MAMCWAFVSPQYKHRWRPIIILISVCVDSTLSRISAHTPYAHTHTHTRHIQTHTHTHTHAICTHTHTRHMQKYSCGEPHNMAVTGETHMTHCSQDEDVVLYV